MTFYNSSSERKRTEDTILGEKNWGNQRERISWGAQDLGGFILDLFLPVCIWRCSGSFLDHLDVELKILIHGVDVVEDVSGNSRNNSHQLRVMQLSLGSKGIPEWGWGSGRMRPLRGVQVTTKVIVDGNHTKLGDSHCHVYLSVEKGENWTALWTFIAAAFPDQKKKTGVVERRTNCSRLNGFCYTPTRTRPLTQFILRTQLPLKQATLES